MAVGQLPAEVGTFARYLRELAARLDRGSGWYGVFWRRDPEGMRACLDGREVPPWDVVESLLQDLAGMRAPGFVEGEPVRARSLHTASAAAYDRRPGGRDAVAERLELMLAERRYAAGREQELAQWLRSAADRDDAQRLGDELAWVRDDGRRAAERCTELRARLAAYDGSAARDAEAEPQLAVPDGWFRPVEAVPEVKRRRPRGARFAGIEDDGDAVAAPAMPVPSAAAAPMPRGARFGGAARVEERGTEPAAVHTQASAAARRAAVATVGALLRLRAEGRSGEAHGVLCEAAVGEAGHLPVLADELHRAGLAADWATLLWEVASLPPEQLVSAAGALAAAGRVQDCGQLLRQGVSRPAEEIADAVLALGDAGREREAEALLDAFVRVRTPEEAARVAEGDPIDLVPKLLAAAAAVSPAKESDVLHALRVAGFAS
ncbi:hypothetical protein [Streptomyces beijiangensis]|uniref:UL36 very large tegument protein n=1 Tax=Streptomyces beijiangensis TaxID=163361 RepID=A0A939JII7_9ACTN|nr:hypothetical protein [Streptomyces beijiangensis]MBO0513230.1 hypothetical protein [Streptomyces beijiangensis]